jgi:hypothetical protein
MRSGAAANMARNAANSRTTSSQHEEADLPADGDSPCGAAIFSTRKTFRRSGIGLLTEYPATLEVIRLMLRSRCAEGMHRGGRAAHVRLRLIAPNSLKINANLINKMQTRHDAKRAPRNLPNSRGLGF